MKSAMLTNYLINMIVDDKLLLNFETKFQRKFIQNCHGNIWREIQKLKGNQIVY